MVPRHFVVLRRSVIFRLALAAVGLSLVVLACIFLRPAPPPVTPFAGQGWLPERPFLVAAGGSPSAPPCTLAAFRQALADGFPALGLPLRFTADGEPVVYGPEDLAVNTDGEGPVERLTLGELQALDAGFRFKGPRGDFPFRGHGLQLPLLEEVLAAFPGVPLFLDLIGPPPSPRQAARLAEIVRRWEVSALILVAAGNPQGSAALRRHFPSRPSVATPAEGAAFLRLARLRLGWYARPGYQILRSGSRVPTASQLAAVRARGLAVLAGPVTSRRDAALLHGLGVDVLVLSGPAAAPPLPLSRPAR